MLRILLIAFLLLSGCGEKPEAPPGEAQVTIRAIVPPETEQVYLAGSVPALGSWRADGVAMDAAGQERTAIFTVPEGTEVEYKFTLGQWSREAVDAEGRALANFSLTAEDGVSVSHVIAGFRPDRDTLLDSWNEAGVIGTLVYWKDVESAFLEPPRHVSIWLPPGYDEIENAGRRYPVIYMTDGENLFDPRIANTGTDWGVDEAMMRGAEGGAFDPAIVVAHWSTGKRLEEYSPWHEGPNLARFVIEELKPRIDSTFRTLPGRETTFAMGSSMGGLNAMHLVTRHSEVFSACGCVSTHVVLSERMVAEVLNQPTDGTDDVPYVIRDLESGALSFPRDVRLVFDYGTETLDASYGPGHEALRAALEASPLEEGEDWLVRVYEGAAHDEASWRARVEDQLTWLLAGQIPETSPSFNKLSTRDQAPPDR